VLALNAPFAHDADERIARAFGSRCALEGLQALRARLNAPRALRDYGLEESQLADAADAVLPFVPLSNPAPTTRDDLERLLRRAWEGSDPR
jgi:maleylacetate reductase